MSLPPEILLRIVHEVVTADLTRLVPASLASPEDMLPSLERQPYTGLASVRLAHCNSFFHAEVPREYFEGCRRYGKIRVHAVVSAEEALRWAWEDEWKHFRTPNNM